MVSRDMLKGIGIGLFVVLLLSLGASAFALPEREHCAEQCANQYVVNPVELAASPPVSFSVAVVPSLSTYIEPEPSQPSSPPSSPVRNTSSVATIHSSGSGSSLTIQEMKTVMSGGKNFDFKTKKWSYREALSGEHRNNFLFSWEAHRKRSGVNQLLPSSELFSK